ncbi:P-loop containing nucleoside triphosphate hydrolase protein, partial [Polychytrium aggregatum]|uniref:P-loop containing nucleoside triphosphate hydrolase protein n=1 Tax=Polychytrium aggregatum TaxID=110093 RepID=UPI0022FDB297
DISVYVRARPLLPHELERGLAASVFAEDRTASVHVPQTTVRGESSVQVQEFKADNVYGPDSCNDTIYEQAVRKLVGFALKGGLATVFAYGQTGSGKTFTLTAFEASVSKDLFDLELLQQWIPGASHDDFEIHLSFFEILGKNAVDLLSERAPVKILEDHFRAIQVLGAREVHVRSTNELQQLIQSAVQLRRTEETSKNATSSRSHAICRLRIVNKSVSEAEDGVLYLIDLAGSESHGDSKYHDKERMKETREINTSLSVLKDCIRNRVLAIYSDKFVHIPYRNSKITHLLKDTFEISSMRATQTVVFANVSPSSDDVSQTVNTLRYVGALRIPVPKLQPAPNPADPSTWSNATLSQWVREKSPKSLVRPEILCPTESGRQLLRVPESEFIQRCKQCDPKITDRAAHLFYIELWKLMVDART